MIDARRLSPHLLLALQLSTTPAYGAEVERREWKPLADASYYQGTMTTAKGRVNFRTTTNWVLIERRAAVEISAFDLKGKSMGKISVPPAAVAPSVAPSVKSMTPPAPQETVDYSFDESAYGDEELGAAKTPSNVAPDEPAFPEEAAEVEPSASTPRGADKTASTTAAAAQKKARASLQLGIGKEWLTASGGISKYEGAASIGGTSLSGEGYFGPWVVTAEIAAHNFSTSVIRRDEASGAETEGESKFLRLSGRAVVFYDFLAPAPPAARLTSLGLGLGLGGFRLPLLMTGSDPAVGAELELRSAIGPVVGLLVAHRISSARTVGIEASVQPTTLSKDGKALGTNALVYWRQAFAKAIHVDLGLVTARQRASVPVECGTAPECEDTSTATSSVVQARFGLGYDF